MRVIGLAGWSGAGKTTLLVALIPEFARRGLVVSTVKHAHHAFDVDIPGKDSHAHREAGAREVLIASRRRFALMRGWIDGGIITPRDLVGPDGLHMTDRGYGLLARAVLDQIGAGSPAFQGRRTLATAGATRH